MSSALHELMDVVDAAGFERPEDFFADAFSLRWRSASCPRTRVRTTCTTLKTARCGELLNSSPVAMVLGTLT
jgi:hypothetical protein